MVANKLTVYAYQELLDFGWRRSGTYVYRPDPNGSCCPAYSIRLDASQFCPTPAQRRVLRRFDSFCCGDWARRQRTRRQQQSALEPTLDTTPPSGAPATEVPQVNVEAVADRLAVRWSKAVARHLPGSISQAVTAALENSDPVFTVKKQKPAGAGPADADSQTVCVHSAVCWKAAAQSTPATAASRGTSPRHLSGRSPASCRHLSPTPPVSKNKAKKVRKAAARAAAAVGAVSGPPVSAVAMQLAETVLPAVRSMLAADTTLAPLAPAATAERGHLHVTLRVPGSVPAAAGPELQALLRCPPAAASPPAAGADARCPGAAEGTSACEPMPVPDAAGGEPLDDSVDSDADWSPHSSSACSERRSCEGDSGDAARPQWWLEDPPEGGWQLRTVLQPSSFVEEEYQLYQRYQRAVHKDPPGRASRGGYERFLVSTPWEGTVPRAADPDAPECGYGAFHMQYWLGEHLVAVGVWDILPRCAPLAPSHGHTAARAAGT